MQNVLTLKNKYISNILIGIFAALIGVFLIYFIEGLLILTISLIIIPLGVFTFFYFLKNAYYTIKNAEFIIFIWILLLSGILLFKARTAAELIESPVQIQHSLRILSVFITGIFAFFYILKQNKFSFLCRGPLFFFLLYCLSSILSVLYSSYIGLSAWKAFELIVGFTAIAAVITSLDNKKNIETVITVNFIWNNLLLISVICGALLFPSVAFFEVYGAILPQLHGIFPIINANSVGVISAIALLLILSKIIDQEYPIYFLVFSFCVIFVVFVFAQSRTSIIGLLLGSVALIILKKRLKLFLLLALISIIFIFLSSDLFGKFFESYFLRHRSIDSSSITTLSGRTEGWDVAIEKFIQSPIWGYGISVGAKYIVLSEVPGREDQSGLHNAFLNVLINNGLFGFVPWIISFFWTMIILFKRAINFSKDKLAPLLVAILTFLLVRMTTGDILVYHDNITLLFLGILAYSQMIYLKKI